MVEITIVWTQEKKDKIAEMIEAWMKEYGAFSGEQMAQDDDCNIYACGLLQDIVDDVIKPKTEYDDDEA